jgi:hypothetical protein
MFDKILVAIISAAAGGLMTYGVKAVSLEGRIMGIEKSVDRIERRLFPVTASER